jgi:hypothetical protein
MTTEPLSAEEQCFLLHKWGKWIDRADVERSSRGLVKNTGIQQERRCERCGKLQLRIEWCR